MRDRTRSILQASLQSFIKTGKPITSDFLYENYDFGIKPAMIRWELNDLSEAGFMTQVHVSGGRVPTNKGYRFFVDNLLKEKIKIDRFVAREPKFLLRVFLKGERKAFVEGAANYLQVTSIGYERKRNNIYESGLSFLLSQIEAEGEEKGVLLEVVRDIEFLEKRLRKFKIKTRNLRVFIGESPLIKNDRVALIVEEFNINRGEPFMFLAIGPKRMDYCRSLRFFRFLENYLGN